MNMTSASMDDLFGAQGALADAIEGFTVRAEQIDMAIRIQSTLRRKARLVVEAGTGTGKTFAYLVPALLSDRHVIVSTGTRALQDQLFHRDLPMVAKALGLPVKVALLKGRSNYLCLHRLELVEQQMAMRTMSAAAARSVHAVRQWAAVTRRGDIAELVRMDERDPIWGAVTSTRENCLGVECPKFQRCHVAAARREALAAHIVVVNHHLLMADLVLKEEGFGDLLPGADAVIVDEAHQLPDIAAQFLGSHISMRQMQSLTRDLGVELMKLAADYPSTGAFAQTLDRYLIDAHDAVRNAPERLELRLLPDAFLESLQAARDIFSELARSLQSAGDLDAGAESIRRRCAQFAELLDEVLGSDAPDQAVAVRWCQITKSGFSIHSAPVDVAAQLGALIAAQASGWIFTSATLAIGEDFNHFQSRIGLIDCDTQRFGSPFDYARQALLYLPRMVQPSSDRHTADLIRAALPVLEASGGRAFLLFTSHRALREAAQLVEEIWADEPPFPIFVQGQAPRDALLKNFRSCGNAVLLGTGSFWEGVDVKGTALTVVVIDKLPFAVPDEPLLRARLAAIEDRGGNPFMEEQVPQAVLALKQGVGRLIRDIRDFGVVMIGDPRLTSRPYGRIFLDSLPPMARTTDLQRVTEFLRERLTAADAVTLPPDY